MTGEQKGSKTKERLFIGLNTNKKPTDRNAVNLEIFVSGPFRGVRKCSCLNKNGLDSWLEEV